MTLLILFSYYETLTVRSSVKIKLGMVAVSVIINFLSPFELERKSKQMF